MSSKKGILLIQLGTPDAPTTEACRRYLREFLMDPWVIDIPYLFRALLVYGIISPFRSPKTAHAYASIWTKEGSPLRVETLKVASGLQSELGSDFVVKVGMRYGNPSLEKALLEFQQEGVSQIQLMPLYPQYAEATTRSSLERVYELATKNQMTAQFSVLPPFYKNDFYVRAAIEASGFRNQGHFDHVLFSFHGLPTRQLVKADASKAYCTKDKMCCWQETSANAFCYRHHSVETAKAIAMGLDLGSEPSRWSVSFQSRLGRADWIKPYTEDEFVRLAKAGVKRLAVFCPSFVSDCLETTEEIGIRGAEVFKEAGGEELVLMPSLNHHSLWIRALVQWARS
jgi:ferrochelatase